MAKTAARISRKRVDQLLVDRGMADSRSKAQALVMAGAVFHGERRIDKPGRHGAGRRRAGGARARPSLGFARRPEAGPRYRAVRRRSGRADLPRYRRLDRRLHRCPAPQRRGACLCRRCRPRPACLETAHRSARDRAGKNQCPASEPRSDPGPARRHRVRRQLHRPWRPCCPPGWGLPRRAPG